MDRNVDKELTTLSSKGQLVIPKSFRQRLGLAEGDFVGMVLIDDVIAIKKVEMPRQRVASKVKKAEKEQMFTFEELLYPEKKK
jgi:AbrB family looped-hinge helix DNA binding protein